MVGGKAWHCEQLAAEALVCLLIPLAGSTKFGPQPGLGYNPHIRPRDWLPLAGSDLLTFYNFPKHYGKLGPSIETHKPVRDSQHSNH